MRSSRTALGGLAAVALLVSGLLTACTPAPVVLSGTVRDAGGDGFAGVTVRVYANSSEALVGTAVTDDGGAYRFDSEAVPDGSYRIRFGDADWHDGATSWSTATTVSASTSAPATADDTYDEAPGTLSGTVTDTEGGDPIGDVEVDILDATGAVAGSTSTDGDGTWTSPPVLPGPYKVRFGQDGFATVYNGAKPSLGAATPVEVAAGGAVTGVDATLSIGASISVDLSDIPDGADLHGIVYDPSTGTVVANVAMSESGEGGPGGFIGGISPGTYRFVIIDKAGVVAPWLYGADAGDDSAMNITLAAGDEFVVDGIVFTSGGCAHLAGRTDLSGADLSGRNLLNCDLSGVNLSGANLSGTDLTGANLTGANLSGAIIDENTVFVDADLNSVNIAGTDLTNMWNFAGMRSGGITGTPSSIGAGRAIVDGYFVSDGVDLSGAHLAGADLSGMSITDATLDGASLAHADLRGTDFSFGSLQAVDLTGANLASNGTESASFAYADLTGSVLGGVTVDAGTDFTHANLTSTSWTGVSLAALASGLAGITTGGIEAAPTALPAGWKFFDGYFVGPNLFLNGADLTGIDLRGVDLTGTSFLYSDLSGANLSGVDLSGRSVQYCDLSGADVSNVTVSSTTQLMGDRFTGATMTGTNLSPVSSSNFSRVASGAITAAPTALPSGWSFVSGYFIGNYANLDDADFGGVDLTDVSLANTSVNGAKFATATMTNVSSAGVQGTPASLPTGWFVADSHANNERYLAGPGANLVSAVFAGIDLSGADLTGANLSYAKFLYGVNITGAKLAGATLKGLTSEVNGSPASLPTGWAVRDDVGGTGHLLGPSANVFGAYGAIDFTGVDLSGLNLSTAVFTSTNLTNADLSGTNLSQATMSYVSIGGADLSTADVSWVDFTKSSGTPTGGSTAIYTSTRCPDHTTQTSPNTCVGHGFGA